jgi:hypothetical protein
MVGVSDIIPVMVGVRDIILHKGTPRLTPQQVDYGSGGTIFTCTPACEITPSSNRTDHHMPVATVFNSLLLLPLSSHPLMKPFDSKSRLL